MLSNKSIENLAELLWPEFDKRVDWEDVLGYRILSEEAMDIFEEVGMEVVAEKFGAPDVDISIDLANEIVNKLTVLGIREADRIYLHKWKQTNGLS